MSASSSGLGDRASGHMIALPTVGWLAASASIILLSVLAPLRQAVSQSVATRAARIGLLGDVAPVFDEAFRKEVRELGWVDSQNVTIERRTIEGKYERLIVGFAAKNRLPAVYRLREEAEAGGLMSY